MDDADRIAAELEIRNVLALLALHADAGTVDDYVVLFTEDALWEMPPNPHNDVPGSTRRGRREIAEGVAERRAAGVQGPGSATRHVITTVAVDVTADDEAHAQAYFLYVTDTVDAPKMTTIGHYADTFRRTGEGWKLAHRRIVMG